MDAWRFNRLESNLADSIEVHCFAQLRLHEHNHERLHSSLATGIPAEFASSQLFATAQDTKIRNPDKTKEYALNLEVAVLGETPPFLDVQTIAPAADGDFAEAMRLLQGCLKRSDVEAKRREQCEPLLRRFQNAKSIVPREHAWEL